MFMTSRLEDLLIEYLAFACGSMAKLLELNERSQESKFTASIAGNVFAPPVYAITPAESVVLKEMYGFEKTAQLFLTDNLTGKIDLSKDCIYPENMVERDMGLVIKYRALRRERQWPSQKMS